MLKLGIDARWVCLAMEIMAIASYLVLFNGEPTGFVTLSRSIRKGDPLSQYLFLLCAEGLSSLKVVASQSLHGILTCTNGVRVSHIFLAYDSFIFAKLLWRNVTIS